MKLLGINLIKYLWDLYAKTLIKEIKEYQINGDTLWLHMKSLNIVKMSFLQKLIVICYSLLDYEFWRAEVVSHLTL